ncbi:glycosyltransferase family protein [Maridesulfovibrio sp. FT414]|uniref:glycosyltransferase family protein n=1 Tax=Maridesulfovibrio sp. FT414 TaxID=2979469 RepID=UPI003D805E67
MQRPQRIRVKNESGRIQSLPEGREYFQDLGGSGPLLLLGLGPDPSETARLFNNPDIMYYVECPDFEKQIPATGNLPPQFRKLAPDQLDQSGDRHIFFYTPGKKLYPSFWGPIVSCLTLKKSGLLHGMRSKTCWLPGDGNSLLLPELSRALSDAGFTYRVIDPDAMRKNLLSLLDRELPEMVISVNFNGLDATGETFFMLREAGIKIAVWMVDNPFHLISGINSEYWKQVPLMVTDHWFIPRLEELGAEKVSHLPLATDPAIFHPGVDKFPGIEDRVVFVGRSSFPGKDTFFSGCTFNRQDYDDANAAMNSGLKPHFGWWTEHDGLKKFWPGKEVRMTGFRAEQSGLLWRSTALAEAGNRITIFGDDGWKDFFTDVDLRGPVDYFTVLPSVYAGAELNLNLTSPLLPCGLTQRNFDVWATGGMLITDRTGGMCIFPDDLVNECSFSTPKEIPGLCDRFRTLPRLAKTLSKVWHQLISEQHTYKHRLNNILEFIN